MQRAKRLLDDATFRSPYPPSAPAFHAPAALMSAAICSAFYDGLPRPLR